MANSYFQLVFGKRVRKEKPIAISGIHSDLRMSAQKSCFTIHGTSHESLEEIFKDSLTDNKFLVKIEIDSNDAENLAKSLYLSGITHSTIFPDFSGLALETEERYRSDLLGLVTYG